MREPPAGHTVTHELLVVEEMTVNFGDLGRVHPVLATYELARHFEEASRKVLLPHLEPGEEGIGYSVSVEHTASALVGMRVVVSARFERIQGNRMHVSLVAHNELGEIVGQGSTVQVVLPRVRIEAGFAAIEERWARKQEESNG